jgi:hypothetical protein
MKTKFTVADMPRYAPETLELESGLTLRIECENDTDMGAPWEEHDGHGPVSEWTTRAKASGERLLHSDGRSKRYYDFAAAVKLALKDGWDAAPYHAAFPNETKRQQAERAAGADFQRLRDWCLDRWGWVFVVVTLFDADGNELGQECVGAIESDGDYWREYAAEMASGLVSHHVNEIAERAHWEARDTVTTR